MKKTDGQSHSSGLPVRLFHFYMLNICLAVVHLQQPLYVILPVESLAAKQDERQHTVVAQVLQGASAYLQNFRHLLVRQVTVTVQRRRIFLQEAVYPAMAAFQREEYVRHLPLLQRENLLLHRLASLLSATRLATSSLR